MKIRVYGYIFAAMLLIGTQVAADQQQGLTDKLALLQDRFAQIQSPNYQKTYLSYAALLDVFDSFYDFVYVAQKMPDFAKATSGKNDSLFVNQNQVLLTYAYQLFEELYPKRTTDYKVIMEQWIQDIATQEIATKEQQVYQKEQRVAQLLGRTDDNQSRTFLQIMQDRQQFLRSPIWLKLKAKMSSMQSEPLHIVVIQENERGQKNYVVKQ